MIYRNRGGRCCGSFLHKKGRDGDKILEQGGRDGKAVLPIFPKWYQGLQLRWKDAGQAEPQGSTRA